jgi:hypothetical protein
MKIGRGPGLGGPDVVTGGCVGANQFVGGLVAQQLQHPLSRTQDDDVIFDVQLTIFKSDGRNVDPPDTHLETECLHPIPTMARLHRETLEGMKEAEPTGRRVLVSHEQDNTPDRPRKVGEDVLQQGLDFERLRRRPPGFVHRATALLIHIIARSERIIGGLSIELLVRKGYWQCAGHRRYLKNDNRQTIIDRLRFAFDSLRSTNL